jgi:outer membrane protein
MSVERAPRGRRRLRGALASLLVALALAKGAQAFDPLWTEPGVLDDGVILPGDTLPISSTLKKSPAKTLSLAQAVDMALASNPQVKASWAQIKVQAGQVGEARAAYWPTLSGAFSGVDDRTTYLGSGLDPFVVDSYQANASVSWRVLNFGEEWFNAQAAGQLLEAALASHNATLQKTLSEVIQAYFEAFTDREVFFADCRNAENARQTLVSTRKREAKGVSTRSDTLQATTALDKALLESNRDQGAYQKGLAVLSYAIGLSPGAAVTLPETLDDKADSADEDLKDWMADTERAHPAILAARAQVEAARDKVAAAVSDSLPTVDLTGSYYHNGRPGQALTQVGTDETLVSGTLTVPLFNGFSSVYKVRGAEAQAEAAEAQLQDTEHQTLMDLVKAYADTVSARQNLQASLELLEAASKALEVSQRRYNKGAANILEMLSTQSALANAQEERIRCLADWRSARLRLLASAGQLGRTAIDKKPKGRP